jgi:hypothetical protein
MGTPSWTRTLVTALSPASGTTEDPAITHEADGETRAAQDVVLASRFSGEDVAGRSGRMSAVVAP